MLLLVPCLFGPASCEDHRGKATASTETRIITSPHQYLPGPHNCPQDWSFISHSTEAGDTIYVANYKRSIAGESPDYLTIQVELVGNLPATVSRYQTLRARFMRRAAHFLETVDGLGDRSAILTHRPKHILFQRANTIMEIEAEHLPESAMLFARLVDQRLIAALEREPGQSTQPASDPEVDR